MQVKEGGEWKERKKRKIYVKEKMSSGAPSSSSGHGADVEGSREQIELKYLNTKGDPKEHAACESALAGLMKSSPVVKFMLDSLAKAGCPFSSGHFVCSPCNPENQIAGGFHDQSTSFFLIFLSTLCSHFH